MLSQLAQSLITESLPLIYSALIWNFHIFDYMEYPYFNAGFFLYNDSSALSAGGISKLCSRQVHDKLVSVFIRQL